jgi:hypothetical protein
MALRTVIHLDAGEKTETTASIEWILADLPADASIALRFAGLRTSRPLEQSFTGIARIERPGVFATIGYLLAAAWFAVARTLGLRKRAPLFAPTKYVLVRGAPAVMEQVVLERGDRAAVRMDVRWKSPERGAKHTVQVVQRNEGTIAGGATFRLLGPTPESVDVPQPPHHDEIDHAERESDGRLPDLVVAWNRPNERRD